ncbi:ankyrin repeat protein [Ancylostoma ceylanicum]|uniref:Ankyrin repeat protein n=1 Tax=Ancylostoma ceylanicum TaxID=53326 RepID=A0A0D6LGP8_9BILA|nr:ankyrin repeat protein [Ancylostoma ceylanicum]
MSGDEEEVEELLAKGADINTATVDGLTALHQVFSVIDSKPDMVRFLCEKGADVNAQDNEGWTPLHAAACCGNLAIVRYLCQNGALLNVINSDKELALDLADDESCREYLEHDYRKQGVIPEQCRDQEFATMMRDVQQWIRDGEYRFCKLSYFLFSTFHFRDQPHPRTGATALHVAAAKGYTQLLELLIKAGGNILARDKDGWTPLHAAAHWAEKDSCKILLEHGASITDTNYAGQNVLAVADKDVVEYLEDLERTVDKRKSPPAAPASILQVRSKLLLCENEVLLSSMKVRRLGDGKSPSPPSDSPSLRESADSEPRSPPAAADEKVSSAERSASEPPSLQSLLATHNRLLSALPLHRSHRAEFPPFVPCLVLARLLLQ